MSPPPPGPAPRQKRVPWVPIIVVAAIVLALLLIIPGVVLVVSVREGLAGEKPPDTPTYPVSDELDGELAWTAQASANSDRLGWLFGKTLVYAEESTGRVTAIDTGTGQQRWTYQVPEPEKQDPDARRICAATRQVLDGTVAIAFQRNRKSGNQPIECSGLVLLDLTTGDERWRTVRNNKVRPELAFAGGRLIVADYDLIGYDLDRPKPRWTRKWDECLFSSVAGTPRVLAVGVFCDAVRQPEGWTIDPATGKSLTQVQLGPRPTKPEMSTIQVVTADPVVISHTTVDLKQMNGADALTTLSDDHRDVQSSITLPEVAFDDRVPPYVIAGHRAVVATRDGPLFCYDLRTGRTCWVRTGLAPDGHVDRDHGSQVFLAGTDETSAYGVIFSFLGNAGVFRVELASGDLTMISPAFPRPFERVRAPMLVMADQTLYGVNDGEEFGAAFALR